MDLQQTFQEQIRPCPQCLYRNRTTQLKPQAAANKLFNLAYLESRCPAEGLLHFDYITHSAPEGLQIHSLPSSKQFVGFDHNILNDLVNGVMDAEVLSSQVSGVQPASLLECEAGLHAFLWPSNFRLTIAHAPLAIHAHTPRTARFACMQHFSQRLLSLGRYRCLRRSCYPGT